MSLAVDNPILNNPFEEPKDYWIYDEAERWVKAVNYHGGYGKWELVECREPRTLDKMLNGLFK